MDADDENLTETVDSPDPELSELVAYLDGELDGTAEERIEQRLVADPDLRRRAEVLDRTWQLLDSLEEVSASGQFTQRTIESLSASPVLLSDANSESVPSPPILARRTVARMTVALVLSFVISGVALETGRWFEMSRRDPRDTELLQNVDLLKDYFSYRPVPNLKFLNSLKLQPSKPISEVPR